MLDACTVWRCGARNDFNPGFLRAQPADERRVYAVQLPNKPLLPAKPNVM
jgi:hypothetical protein